MSHPIAADNFAPDTSSIPFHQNSDVAEPVPAPDVNAPYVFENIIPKLGPSLRTDKHPSLLPIQGGRPGFVYYQCPISYLKLAQDDPQYRWSPVVNTSVYTIRGPKGQLDLQLLASGAPIRGSDHQSNQRILLLHPDVWEVTGLDPETGFPPAVDPKEAPEAATQTSVPTVAKPLSGKK